MGNRPTWVLLVSHGSFDFPPRDAGLKQGMKFSLHSYIKHLRDTDASEDYIKTVQRHARTLVNNNLPVILTLGHLAHSTNSFHNTLLNIVKREVDPYRVFSIGKKSGGKRLICAPELNLLNVQRWINQYILKSELALKKISSNTTAYVPGGSHIKNAERHVGASWIIKIDIVNFFESISERQVYYVFRELGYRALVAFNLARLCTRILPHKLDNRKYNKKRWSSKKQYAYCNSKVAGHLPQGAPTSPMLANLVCVMLDAKLQCIASEYGLSYTRYADDMTFSGHFEGKKTALIFMREISNTVINYGFSINSQKSSIAKDGGRKIVTGLSVDGENIRLPRAYKDKIRQEIFYIKKYSLEGHCSRTRKGNRFSYIMHLAGKIRYAILVEPTFGNKMMSEFVNIFPDFLDMEKILNSSIR